MTEAELEQLRQESETFNETKRQAAAWFRLRLTMGYSGLALIILIAATCLQVIVRQGALPAQAPAIASGVLVGDLAAFFAATWRLVLNTTT